MADPFGRALRDHYHGDRTEPLVQRDGQETLEHPIEQFYFESFDADEEGWLVERLDGPLLDVGAGAGRHALHFQEAFETVALEVSDELVALLDERGVENTVKGDMFALRETFERDRFRSALAIGTQLGLAGSMQGLRQFLGDLAFVTTPDATAVVDCYDPERDSCTELLGVREDPAPGLAHRVMHFEYGGSSSGRSERDAVGETLYFRLFSPGRLREAVVGTGWSIEDVRYTHEDGPHYRAALAKR